MNFVKYIAPAGLITLAKDKEIALLKINFQHMTVGRGAECGYRRYRAATYPSGQQASKTKLFLLDFCANGQKR